MPPDPGAVRRVLVVTLSNLGDVILTLPVISALSKAYPSARIDAAVGAGGRVALEKDARISEVIEYPRKAGLSGRLRLIGLVRSRRYDVIVDLRYSPVGFFGGARWTNRYFFRGERPLHRGQRHLAALRGLVAAQHGQETDFGGAPPAAGTLPAELLAAAKAGKLVTAAPGSKSDLKKWAPGKFARVLDKLAMNDGMSVVLVGDASDEPSAKAVARSMEAPALNLCGATDYEGLRAVIAVSSLVLTNDSAPLHLAESLGIPAVALFGPTDPLKYGPRLHGDAVSRGLFCSPCERAQCRFGHECLDEMSAEEVYQRTRKPRRAAAPPRSPRILMVRLDRIGDLVLSLPAVREVRRRHPRAWICLLVRPSLRTLIEGHPDIDEVIPYEYEKRGRHSGLGNFRLISEIRKRRFDTAFILHPSNRSVLVPFFAGIRERVGLRSGPHLLLTRSVPDRRRFGGRHEAEMTLDVVRAPETPSDAWSLARIEVDPEERARIRRRFGSMLGPETPVVALHPGASCPSKRWPAERFARLASRILENTGSIVAVVGGQAEKQLGLEIAREAGHAGRVLDLTGQLDLKELAAFLQRSSALVSNDSGPVHIAAAVGTPVVSIFGRNQPGLGAARWRPLGPGHAVVRRDVGCVVCLAHRCPIEFECLRAVTVDDVWDALEGVLSRREAPVR